MEDARKELIESCSFVNINLDENQIKKCISLCTKYGITPEDLVNDWIGLKMNKGHTNLDIEELTLLLQKLYSKKEVTSNKFASESNEFIDGNIDTSNVATPKRLNIRPAPQTPVTQSPLSQVTTPSQSGDYSSRTDAGKVILNFGPQNVQKLFETKKPIDFPFTVKLETHCMPENAKYMNETLPNKSTAITEISEIIIDNLLSMNNLQQYRYKSQLLFGTIHIYKDKESHITNTILIPSRRLFKHLKMIPLNLSLLKSHSLISGQSVVVVGNLQNADKESEVFIVDQLYSNIGGNVPKYLSEFPEILDVVVAAGPFTVQNNLSFEPLQDLLKYILLNKPNVLILTGPFYEGDYDFDAENLENETYQSFFETLVSSVMEPLKELSTKVVLVSSYRDRHHDVVYPTLPYKLRETFKNLMLCPDPSILNISDFVVGITSVDIISHMIAKEKSGGLVADRFARCSRHILEQQGFYPLYPPDENMSIDHDLLEKHGCMNGIPHLLILPSKLRYFVKEINGCIVMNPEYLSKFNTGGTFARILVNSGSGASRDKIACQIIKI